MLIDHIAHVERQQNRKLQRLRSDGGGEFLSNEFRKFLRRKGIIHEISPPYTPEYNGVVERHQRSINERLRVFMFEGKFPNHLWPELMKTAVYIFNCTMQKGIGETTPYERWNQIKH